LALAQHSTEVADERINTPQGRTPLEDASQIGVFGFAAIGDGPDDPAGDRARFRRRYRRSRGRNGVSAPGVHSDAQALRDRTDGPDIASVTPMVTGSAVVRVGTAARRLTIIGTVDDYVRVTDRTLAAGRWPTLSQPDTGREILLGPTPVIELFGGDPAAAIGLCRQRLKADPVSSPEI
jgi:hypothetical protein